jgi:hypothetical protein
MALTANLHASFVLQFPGMDDSPLGLGGFDMFGAGTMAFFASDIELNIFGFISPFNLFQLEPGIMAARTAHFKGFFYRRCLQTAIFFVPVLEVVGNPSRGGLVPLKGEDIMIVPHLDLIALFPAPSPVSPHHSISHLF